MRSKPSWGLVPESKKRAASPKVIPRFVQGVRSGAVEFGGRADTTHASMSTANTLSSMFTPIVLNLAGDVQDQNG